jgi:hypothetical protein
MEKEKKRSITVEVEIFVAILAVVALVVISGILSRFPSFVNPIIGFFPAHENQIVSGTKLTIGILTGLSIPVSVMLLVGIILSVERLKTIRKKEDALLNTPVEMAYEVSSSSAADPNAVAPDMQNKARWRKILAMVDSSNQNDWRQAIIESDIILDEILTKMSYHGDDLGSKLRGATKADFKTLEQAGEAHGIRNRIAHDGSNYPISQHEAKRVVNLYRQVFEEFFYI